MHPAISFSCGTVDILALEHNVSDRSSKTGPHDRVHDVVKSGKSEGGNRPTQHKKLCEVIFFKINNVSYRHSKARNEQINIPTCCCKVRA